MRQSQELFPIASGLLALLVAVPLLVPGGEQWQLTPSGTGIKDPSADHPLRPLVLGAWVLKPSFARSNVVLKASDGSSFAGSLFPAPELNIFSERDRRYYRLRVQGQSMGTEGITGSGQLELKGTALASSNALAHPKLAEIEWAKLILSLQASNLPPVETMQELLKPR